MQSSHFNHFQACVVEIKSLYNLFFASRLLTQKIRSRGTMLGKVVVAPAAGGAGDGGPEALEAALEAEAEAVGWVDPAKANLVKEVSVKVCFEQMWEVPCVFTNKTIFYPFLGGPHLQPRG